MGRVESGMMSKIEAFFDKENTVCVVTLVVVAIFFGFTFLSFQGDFPRELHGGLTGITLGFFAEAYIAALVGSYLYFRNF